MNRQELLTKLAMELAQWPEYPALANPDGMKIRGWRWEPLGLPTEWMVVEHGGFRSDCGVITRADYLAERERLINKPSWGDAPKWASHLIQDPSGTWYWARNIHSLLGGMGSWESDKAARAATGHIPAGHDWRETLELRPEAKPERICDGRPMSAEGPKREAAVCPTCSQTDTGQTGEHPCPRCGLPRVHDKANEWWEGAGTPSAGEEFEFSANGSSWEERVMLFNDGFTCLMAHRKYPANRWHYKCDDPALRFRPIRSEEDRAVEGMVPCIQDAANGVYSQVNGSTAESIARALYRAIKSGEIKLEAQP